MVIERVDSMFGVDCCCYVMMCCFPAQMVFWIGRAFMLVPTCPNMLGLFVEWFDGALLPGPRPWAKAGGRRLPKAFTTPGG